jgi:hypothetical protein
MNDKRKKFLFDEIIPLLIVLAVLALAFYAYHTMT